MNREKVNLSQAHTVLRTIILVDVPSCAFLVACALIGWPIAITMHALFFWIGIIAFGSIAIIGILKLESKTLIPIGRDRETFQIEIEQRRQNLLPPYPNISIEEENVKDETVSIQSKPIGTLSQEKLSQDVSLSQGVKSDNGKVAAYLVDHPGASIREIEKGTHIPRASIGRTPAWKNR